MFNTKVVSRRAFLKNSAVVAGATILSQNSLAIAASESNDLALMTLRIRNGDGCGSAICFGDNLAFTAAHCVDKPSLGITVEPFTRSSFPSPARRYNAEVVAADRATDVAIIRIETRDPLPVLRLCPLSTAPRGVFKGIFAGCAGGRPPRSQQCVVRGRTTCVSPNGKCDGSRWSTAPSPEPGMSGGPLIDSESNCLIGLASCGDLELSGYYTSLEDMHSLARRVVGSGSIAQILERSKATSESDRGAQMIAEFNQDFRLDHNSWRGNQEPKRSTNRQALPIDAFRVRIDPEFEQHEVFGGEFKLFRK